MNTHTHTHTHTQSKQQPKSKHFVAIPCSPEDMHLITSKEWTPILTEEGEKNKPSNIYI